MGWLGERARELPVTGKRHAFAAMLLAACGARTDLGGLRTLDASVGIDATSDVAVEDVAVEDVAVEDVAVESGSHDAIAEDVVPAICDFGTLVSDPFGSTVLWNGGAPLPQGHYRVTYIDGCMKYASTQGWSVNAYANGPDTLYVVTNGTTIAPAPGTVGFNLGNGGFAAFDDCVSTNLANDVPLEFDFAGGVIGLHLDDAPYSDNVAGENGRNPAYRLSSCK